MALGSIMFERPFLPGIHRIPVESAVAATAWDDALADLRNQFVREAVPKLASLAQLVDQLSVEPTDDAALRELHRRFHGFAGTGSSYGLPKVSLHAARGEIICASLVEEGSQPGGHHVTEWRVIKESLESAFAEAEAAATLDRHAVAPATPLDVLILDDDSNLCRIAARVFEHEGMRVRTAAGEAEALRLVDERLPDCILVDVCLSEGSGYGFIEKLRARPDGEGPAVLVISVRNDFQGRVHSVSVGADGYFEKPIDWEALLRRLHHVLERTNTEPGRILSVEDDPQQSEFLRTVLESGGYKFRSCSNPGDFESDLVAFKPDLVLMDVNLPEYNGYDLVRYVRQNEKYATLPIMFLTTESAMKAHIASARAGGDEHLVKPVSPGRLLSTVAARVERARFLKSLLERDGLTRLLTHTACQERAKALVAERQRHPRRPAAWVMIDLDHFKTINDRYGHPTGDKVLTSLAALLRRRLRQSDTVARYGGEEFVILLEDLDEPEALRLVSRLLGEFSALPHLGPGGTRFQATFSAGVAMLDLVGDPASTAEGWKQAADDALYRAKAAGRNRVMGTSTSSSGPTALARPRAARGPAGSDRTA